MKKYIHTILIVLSIAGVALGRTDNNAISAGATQPHNFKGISLSGAYGNPALVGLDMLPRGGMSLFPVSIALWSDKLAPPFNRNILLNPLDFEHSLAIYLTTVFEKSFGVNELMHPDTVSKILTNELKGGIGLYTGLQLSPYAFATRGFAFNARTYADVDMRIPEGFLLPFFSATDGLLGGNTLDVSDLNINGIWASEIAVKLGLSMVIPAFRDYLKLNKGAAGVGLKFILGHSYLDMNAHDNSKIVFDTSKNNYKVDAKIDVTSIGTGFHGAFDYDLGLFVGKKTISGQGWGLDLGAVFHNDNHLFSIDVQDIGMIFWDGRQIHKGTLVFDRELDLEDFSGTLSEIFDLDSLENVNHYMTTLQPAALNVGYTFFYDLSANEHVNFVVKYFSAAANMRQQIILGPGQNTYSPRFGLGGSLGLLSGSLPIRYGIISGGPEKLASVAGIGLDFQFLSLDASYKAIGSLNLNAKKGFETAASLTFRWGRKRPQQFIKLPKEDSLEPTDQQPPLEPEPEPVSSADEQIIITPPLPELDDFPEIKWENAPDEAMQETPVREEPLKVVQSLGSQPTVAERDALSAFQRAINFKEGGADLMPSSFAALDEIANLLKQYSNLRYEIQGHTDSQGRDIQNLLLSAERAATVKKYLVLKGAPETSLIAIGYGPNRPIADNKTAAGRALNRRVELEQILSQEQYETLKQFEHELMKSLTKEVLRQ